MNLIIGVVSVIFVVGFWFVGIVTLMMGAWCAVDRYKDGTRKDRIVIGSTCFYWQWFYGRLRRFANRPVLGLDRVFIALALDLRKAAFSVRMGPPGIFTETPFSGNDRPLPAIP